MFLGCKEDIANWMMSGTPNRNIETRYLNYLHTVDPDLYNVAMRIGMEVRTYGFMEDLYSPDEAFWCVYDKKI